MDYLLLFQQVEMDSTWLLGISFDKTILYHRWLGRWTIFLATVHWITSWIHYSIQNQNQFGLALQQISSANKDNFGYPSLAALVIIFITSLDYIRRNKYEVFFYLHYFFVIFYLFGLLHSNEMLVYTIIALILYVLDIVIRIIYGTFPMKTLKIVSKEGDLTQVIFPKHLVARFLKLHKVGQYMFINFPSISKLEWHPFSVSSGPDETTVEIHIKALGDHTRKLVDFARSSTQMWIRSDGPYGNIKLNYRRFPYIVLAAGGIGVTPVVGILKDIFRYGQLDPRAAAHKHKSLVEKVYLVWTVSNRDQYLWFAQEIKWFMTAMEGKGMPRLEIVIHMTKGDAEEQFIYPGRPDFFNIFSKLANEHQLADKAALVFACGPRKMVNNCWDAVSEQQREGAVIHFHHETFEF